MFGSGIVFTEKTIDEKSKRQTLLLDGRIYGKKGPPIDLEENLFLYSIDMNMLLYTKGEMHGSLGLKMEAIITNCC